MRTVVLVGFILKGRVDILIRQLDRLFDEVYSLDLPRWRQTAARQDAEETAGVLSQALVSAEGREVLGELAKRGLTLDQAVDALKKAAKRQASTNPE